MHTGKNEQWWTECCRTGTKMIDTAKWWQSSWFHTGSLKLTVTGTDTVRCSTALWVGESVAEADTSLADECRLLSWSSAGCCNCSNRCCCWCWCTLGGSIRPMNTAVSFIWSTHCTHHITTVNIITHAGWWRDVVRNAFRLKRSYSTLGPVSAAMGDCRGQVNHLGAKPAS